MERLSASLSVGLHSGRRVVLLNSFHFLLLVVFPLAIPPIQPGQQQHLPRYEAEVENQGNNNQVIEAVPCMSTTVLSFHPPLLHGHSRDRLKHRRHRCPYAYGLRMTRR